MEELVNEILTKTKQTKDRYEELTKLVSDPDIIADNRQWKKLVKERSSIEEIANAHDELEKMHKEYQDALAEYKTESDHELKQMFFEEMERLKGEIEKKVEEVIKEVIETVNKEA